MFRPYGHQACLVKEMRGMVGWPTVLIALGSVAVGSILTMIGQAFADRRVRSRDREARREDFLARNFDTQREALLKVQELADEIAASVLEEDRRKVEDGVYAYFESKPNKRVGEDMMSLVTKVQELQTVGNSYQSPWSEAEKKEVEKEIRRIIRDGPDAINRINAEMETMISYAMSDKRKEFLLSLGALFQTLTLNMYRTGSDAVVSAVNNFMNAVVEYNGRLVMRDIEEYQEEARKARVRLHEVIARELKRGPF
jgi:hypothetical protein